MKIFEEKTRKNIMEDYQTYETPIRMKHAGTLFAKGRHFFDIFIGIHPVTNKLILEVPLNDNEENSGPKGSVIRRVDMETASTDEGLSEIIDDLLSDAAMLTVN